MAPMSLSQQYFTIHVLVYILHYIQIWLSTPGLCLVLILSSFLLVNLSIHRGPTINWVGLDYSTCRRAVDVTYSFTTLSVIFWITESFTVRSLPLSLLAHTHFLSFSLIISTSLLNDSSFHSLLSLFFGRPLYQTHLCNLSGGLLSS